MCTDPDDAFNGENKVGKVEEKLENSLVEIEENPMVEDIILNYKEHKNLIDVNA